jgi:putative ABC transport system substrate-binding protein
MALASGVAAWPLVGHAQVVDRKRRIGVLIGYAEGDPQTKERLAAFAQGLQKRGWSSASNAQIDYRFAGGSESLFQSFAKELIALEPDVILAHTTPAAAAVQRESRTVPVVFVNVSDPIGAGFISSLANPGGNLTGMLHVEAGIVGKWLAMLKEIAPGLTRVALVANPKTTPFYYFSRAAEMAASSSGLVLVPSPVATSGEIERVIESLGRVPNSGMVLPPDSTTVDHRNRIIDLAARHRVPAAYSFTFFVTDGGLMSYGTDQVDLFRHAANYVDRILRGDKPADLPVQAPTRFETAVNVKTARTLGLAVPYGLLLAADELID